MRKLLQISMKFELLNDVENAKKNIPINQLTQIKIKNLKIALLRKNEDKWLAFKDACPHLQVSLIKGELTDDNCVICLYHRYKFSLESGREVSGKNTSELIFFALSIQKNKLFVEIDDHYFEEKDEFSF